MIQGLLLAREVSVGKLRIGGRQALTCQSMITADTVDTDAAWRDMVALADAGAQLVRLTVPGLKAARALEPLRKRLDAAGLDLPLVADIHFSPDAALLATDFVDKVRINPGNFAERRRQAHTDDEYRDELERIGEVFSPLVEKCAALGRAIRIGTNHGSLSERVLARYGDTPRGMVESALEYARLAEAQGFHDIIFSMKASNLRVAIDSGRLLAVEQLRRAESEGLPIYPFHLGVTEAGGGEDARTKSFLGIGGLLAWGIGDTLRVSLTEDAVEELPAARALAAHFDPDRKDAEPWTLAALSSALADSGADPGTGSLPPPYRVSDPDQDHPVILAPSGWQPSIAELRDIDWGECAPDHVSIENREGCADLRANDDLLALCLGPGMKLLEAGAGGLRVLCGNAAEAREGCRLAFSLLQNTRLRSSRAEFISCPGCGRTHFDLKEVSDRVRERFGHLKGVRIAVMGCIVNGPGEMADAHFGYVGAAPGRVDLYRGRELVERNVREEEAVEKLAILIEGD